MLLSDFFCVNEIYEWKVKMSTDYCKLIRSKAIEKLEEIESKVVDPSKSKSKFFTLQIVQGYRYENIDEESKSEGHTLKNLNYFFLSQFSQKREACHSIFWGLHLESQNTLNDERIWLHYKRLFEDFTRYLEREDKPFHLLL